MFKPGDEVAIVRGQREQSNAVCLPDIVYVVSSVGVWDGFPFVCLVGHDSGHPCKGFAAHSFRKVERKSDSLSIESFLTIKPNQFEGPTRTNQPAKRKEKA